MLSKFFQKTRWLKSNLAGWFMKNSIFMKSPNLVVARSMMTKTRLLNTVQYRGLWTLEGSADAYSTLYSSSATMSSAVSKFESFPNQPDVLEITNLMQTIIELTLTQSEYLTFKPFLYELGEAGKTNLFQITNGSQILWYYQYYMLIDDQDYQFQSELDGVFVRTLSDLSTEMIVEITGLLRHNDRL